MSTHVRPLQSPWLISGIPGIGKTHLADYFIRQVENENVKALVLGTSGLASSEGLLALIGRSMGAEDQFLRAAGIDDKVSGIRGTVAGVLSGGVTLDAHYPLAEHMVHGQLEDVTRQRAGSIVGKDAVDASVRHGVLTTGEHGLLSFGIPSFRTHMIRQAAAYRELADREVPPR